MAFNRNQQEFSVLHSIVCRDTVRKNVFSTDFSSDLSSHLSQALKLRAGTGGMKLQNRIFQCEGSFLDYLVQGPDKLRADKKLMLSRAFSKCFLNTDGLRAVVPKLVVGSHLVPVGPGSQSGLLSNGDFNNLLLIYTRTNDI